jgi:hypothetical protein
MNVSDFKPEGVVIFKTLAPAPVPASRVITPPDPEYSEILLGTQQFQGLATGGRVTTGGNFVVGERGAEVVNLPRGYAVTSNADVGRSLDNTQDTYNITVNVGGDNDNIGDAVEKGILEAIDQGRLDSVHSLQQRSA